MGLVLAWLVIVGTITFIIQSEPRWKKKEEAASGGASNIVLELIGRYTVGAHHVFSQTGMWTEAVEAQYLGNVAPQVKTPADELKVELLRAWLRSEWPRAERLDALASQNEALKADVEAIRLLQKKTALDDAAWHRLEERHGWLAQLARALPHENTHETRVIIYQQATRTLMALGLGTMGVVVAMAVGLALCIVFIVKRNAARSRGAPPPIRFTRPCESPVAGGVLVEAFAIYLGGFVWLPALVLLVFPEMPQQWLYLVILGVVCIAVLWPRWRGVPTATWRQALGLHCGAGVWREMGAGLAVWLAALPFTALALLLSSWLAAYSGSTPVHPIVKEFAGSDASRLAALALAVLWAPVTEELTFRGLLFPGLAARWRLVAGVVASSFLFAAVHPQGWAGVPPLMVLAAAFSLIRAWRGSLIGGITAHALNNGLITLMMLAAF